LNPKEQLMYLLKHYYMGEYTTIIFVDEFHRIYNFEVTNSDLSQKELELLSELAMMTGRFSFFEEDLKIPNAFFNENDIKQKATAVYVELVGS